MEWKCQIDYVLHFVQCDLVITACVREVRTGQREGEWLGESEHVYVCVRNWVWESTCTGGLRTVLTGDSWGDIIRICSLAQPSRRAGRNRPFDSSLNPKMQFSTPSNHIYTHKLLLFSTSNVYLLPVSLGAISPSSPPQNAPTPPGLHICFSNIGCFRCVSMSVCTPPECVCVWLGWRGWPSSLLLTLKQSSFEMTSEQKPVCALPQRHTTILQKILPGQLHPGQLPCPHYTPLPPHTAAYHTNGS